MISLCSLSQILKGMRFEIVKHPTQSYILYYNWGNGYIVFIDPSKTDEVDYVKQHDHLVLFCTVDARSLNKLIVHDTATDYICALLNQVRIHG